MTDAVKKAAEWFKSIAQAVEHHNESCRYGNKAFAVRLAWIDIQDVGWEVGDTVYPGVKLEAGGQKGRIIVECGGDHGHNHDDAEVPADEPEITEADGYLERVKREERDRILV